MYSGITISPHYFVQLYIEYRTFSHIAHLYIIEISIQ